MKALTDGRRSRATLLLHEASHYPTTPLLSHARTASQAANARAAARAQAQPAATPPAAPQPSPASGQRCDPNYTGACLNPNSPDYDCQGGSGNGPDYTGPVHVVGNDHYGLDRDGDGQGCE